MIAPVTAFQITCDFPGCKITSSDVCDDAVAWSDPAQAAAEWRDSGCYVINNGVSQLHACEWSHARYLLERHPRLVAQDGTTQYVIGWADELFEAYSEGDSLPRRYASLGDVPIGGTR